MGSLVSVSVRGVYIVETASGALAPVVLLEDERSRIVPIFVGLSEAMSIHNALSGEVTPRPMTHDLFISIMESLDARITKALIDDLDEGVFYARITIGSNSVEHEIDARPSDCVALALRSKASIHMQEEVISGSCVDKSDLENLTNIEAYL